MKAPPGRARRGRIKPADPFDLIRWLARSQADPRKAVAELVQNSIDAGAKKVGIVRERRAGVPMIRILDDGHGVFADLPSREEALVKIATNVGRSHKLGLSAEERARQVGRYGIGILGFWCVGRHFEMRSSVAGQGALALRLAEDDPKFEVVGIRGRLAFDGTWTEVRVGPLHASATRVLSGRRLADFLAAELRGQILETGVEITIEDKMSRGRAEKRIRVEPPAFRGTLIDGLGEMPVVNFPAAHVVLYIVPEDAREVLSPAVSVACQGSLVVDDVSTLSEFAGPPWNLRALDGIVEFPALTVPPGTRRGIVPDDAYRALADALHELEPRIVEAVGRAEAARASVGHEEVLADVRRTFRDVASRLPHYDLLPVRRPSGADEAKRAADGAAFGGPDAAAEAGGTNGEDEAAGVSEATAAVGADAGEEEQITSAAPLLPPGPVETVEIRPSRARIGWGGERAFRAFAIDSNGNAAAGKIGWTWSVVDLPGASLEAGGDRAVLRVGNEDAVGRVVARAEALGMGAGGAEAGGRAADGFADVRVSALAGDRDSGVPDPVLVQASTEDWRSRMRGVRWEVNAGHPDFQSTEGERARRVRYLAALYAKEMVQATYGDQRSEPMLERLVEVLTAVDLSLGRPGRKR